MELWKKKIAILYISTCDLPWKPPVPPVGSVPGEERALEPNPSCRGEIFRLKAWSNGRCCCLWKVSLEYQDSDPVCLPDKIISYPQEKSLPPCSFVVSKCFKVNTKHLWDTPGVLSQYFISLPVSVDKSESCCENMGVLVSSIALGKVCQPCHFSKGVSLSEPLWRERVRNNRFMWHSDIWRSWIPFYSSAEVKFRVLEEPGKNAGVQLAANSLKKKKKSPSTIPEPPSSRSLWKGTGKVFHMAITMMKFLISLVCSLGMYLVIYTSLYQRTISWKLSQGFLHFMQTGGPIGILQSKVYLIFPGFPYT